METTVLKGNFIDAPALGQLRILEQGYLVMEDGVVIGRYETLPADYAACPVRDYGDALVMQSFADMHLHAPQYPMLGMGMDLPLLDWLQTYTFRTEAAFGDTVFARETYRQLARELIANGTTRVCMFSSIHTDATLILMEELEAAGICGYVGKVNMDRNSIPELTEETGESMAETLRWLSGCEKFKHIRPILTPRFTPSCSDEMMDFLGTLAAERALPIQSHLAENRAEVDWVRELHPDCTQYWQTYAKFGLWNDKTVMAHCVWCDERERTAMAKAGVLMAHCADSNVNLCSGISPVRQMLADGVAVALGSDIAGGAHLHMFDVVADSIRASKCKHMESAWSTPSLSVEEGYYLGTTAGHRWLGGGDGFAIGKPLHAIVVADGDLPAARPLALQERFQRSIYRRQENAIRAVWSQGRLVVES